MRANAGYAAAQNRSRGKGCPTLWAVIDPQVVQLVPICLDTFQAKRISTKNGDGVPQHISTQTTHIGFSHGLQELVNEMEKKEQKGWCERDLWISACIYKYIMGWEAKHKF